MIRINLLAVERGKARKKVTLDRNQQVAIGGGLLVVLAVLFVGWRYWSLSSESTQIDVQIATEQREQARLATIIAQVQQYELQRTLLTQRVTLIEELKSQQTGPVHMLDEISRALPDRMWLTSVKQGTNGEVNIEGDVTILTRLPDFINSLEASGYFRRQIDIISFVTGPPPSGYSSDLDVTRFNIRAQFQPPGTAQPQPAAAAAAPAGRGR